MRQSLRMSPFVSNINKPKKENGKDKIEICENNSQD